MKAHEMREALRKGTVIVTFTKRNGEVRELVCTLQAGVIPEVYGSTPPSDSLVTVWDLENDAWRSFRVDSLIAFEAVKAAA